MSKGKCDSAQLSLLPPDPALAEDEIRRWVRLAIKRCPYSREQVAVFLGIRPSILNAYCAESKADYKFPVSRLVPLCRLTGDLTILYRLCDTVGVTYHRDPKESMYAELGRQQVARERATALEDDLKRKLLKDVSRRRDEG